MENLCMNVYKSLAISSLMVGMSIIPAYAVENSTDNIALSNVIQNDVNNTKIVEEKELDFKVKIVEDNQLPQGVEIIVDNGSKGVKTTYESIEKTIDSEGKEKDSIYTYDVITKPVVDKVIRVGTNTEVVSGISEKTKQVELEKTIQEDMEKQRVLELEQQAQKELEERKHQEELEKNNVDSNVSETAEVAVAEQQANVSSIDNSSSSAKNGEILNKEADSVQLTDNTVNSNIKDFVKNDLSGNEFKYANFIITRESGWNPKAQNPSSTAYGLGQLLYHDNYVAGANSKYGVNTSDWKTNPQSQYLLMKFYVESRYGTWEKAYNFWLSNHWY